MIFISVAFDILFAALLTCGISSLRIGFQQNKEIVSRITEPIAQGFSLDER